MTGYLRGGGTAQSALPPLKPTLRVLYLFAGKERRNDVKSFLMKSVLFSVEVREIDLLRSSDQNVLLVDLWKELTDKVGGGFYDIVIVTPPCNTFSRALWHDSHGPARLRDRQYPLGYPWLSGKNKQKCMEANVFVEKSMEMAELCHKAGAWVLSEHPEDLGRARLGVPASMWSWELLRKTSEHVGAHTAALRQCSFGADYEKPTRLWGTAPFIARMQFQGWPAFDKNWRYLGPIEGRCGHNHQHKLIGHNTSPAAAYPPAMCKWIAEELLKDMGTPPPVFLRRGSLSSTQVAAAFPPRCPEKDDEQKNLQWLVKPYEELGGTVTPPASEPGDDDVTSGEEEEGVPKPRLADFAGGLGQPLQSCWAGKTREFHDGAGLCSPGRFLPARRKRFQQPALVVLRGNLKKIMKSVLGNVSTEADLKRLCTVESNHALLEKAADLMRTFWIKWALRMGEPGHCEDVPIPAEFQPFYLDAMSVTLKVAGDPDFRVLTEKTRYSFKAGVPVGFEAKIGRMPAVYERKETWRKLDESEYDPLMKNYASVAGNEEVILKQFRAEQELGMMSEMDEQLAKDSFPNLLIAAQGCIQKADESWRVLHDGTHGIRLNNSIALHDRTRMPTASDLRSCMCECAETGKTYLSMQADVRMAHRRILHRESDWPLLACAVEPGKVWLNRVGTFGISTASYWWGRMASLVARLVWAVMDTDQDIWQMLFADDLRWVSSGPDAAFNMLFAFLIWKVVGTPFKLSKLQVDRELEWVGYWLDVGRFTIGMSASRMQWLHSYLKDLVEGKACLVRDVEMFLGRLAYATGALEYGRPFLGPLYAWVTAVPAGTFMKVPVAIRVLMTWFLERLAEGAGVTCTRKVGAGFLLFKADAKGEPGLCVLGGYKVAKDGGIAGPWFSLKISESDAPWLFKDGEASRRIATSEMLASLLCLWLFTDDLLDGGAGGLVLSGLTDNAGNAAILTKMSTSKLPVAPVLLEMAKLMFRRRLEFSLLWTPREKNVLADALTNGDFTGFDLSQRRGYSPCRRHLQPSLISSGTPSSTSTLSDSWRTSN